MKRDLASVLVRQFEGQLDAMDGRREAGDEKPALGAGEDFVELAAHGALAGRVAVALDVGGILKQRQHALFAVFGEGMQIEELVVGGRGIDFEIAGMDDDAQRRVNRERNAIDQAVRDLDRMDGERSQLEALVGAHLAQVGVVEQAVLFELVFHIGQREFGAKDGNVQLARESRAARRCGLRARG